MDVVLGTDTRDLDDRFISTGRYAATVAEMIDATGASPDAIRSSMRRLASKRRAFSPARGLYVFVPSEYRSWGVVPAEWFIDSMMAHLGRTYYVGLLSGAELHGAAHQRPQVTQVVVDQALPGRDIERVRLRFYATNADLGSLPVQRRNTKTGTLAVSSPELTVVDLCGRPVAGGGLDNVATIIRELSDDGLISTSGFAQLVARVPSHALRRAAHLVESLTELRLDVVAEAAGNGGEPVPLDPHGARRGTVDRRWNIRVNVQVEPEA